MPKENQPGKDGDIFGITDDYMFFTVMQDNRLCTRLLQELFPLLKIQQVNTGAQEQIKNSWESKAVRLDIRATDEAKRIYDLEMQKSSKFKPKRVRYYRAVIDAYLLLHGKSYDELPPATAIVFSPFANVDSEQKICCFKTYCPEEKIALADESLVYIINSKGTQGKVSPTLQKFLDLMNGQADLSDDFIKEVYEKMCEYSKDQGWQADRLAYIAQRNHFRYEGREEGRKEGIAEGEERKLVQNLRTAIRKGMTPAEAMDFLEVPEKDRPKISKMLEPEKV
ncbi:Rpn family recombination-promoting nuclease/putative transposase [Lactobacillus sp.]|uniref:Rpn family recombination-promoting nuclease/putative transposase n=1 Tax=Lactobacillus sp. TaxID=1591 RepID=UPI003EF2423D